MGDFPWWVLIPLAAILFPVITTLINNRMKLKELEMRQGAGPEFDEIDKKLDQILARLDALEEKKEQEKE
ncbi:hypothetical protein JCM19047_1640 [Bacillus sp. JCM 19047]|uniref:hypothetical protein n=1 Tax=Shouchella miscanthi TaxID=2598861 RepID=UPI0003F03992|nr:hypothetical protein [Shouchella miscanthi]GAF21918.1 hypothetical protein JCM19047_1640 [Bacillus sp. JCM 19047]